MKNINTPLSVPVSLGRGSVAGLESGAGDLLLVELNLTMVLTLARRTSELKGPRSPGRYWR